MCTIVCRCTLYAIDGPSCEESETFKFQGKNKKKCKKVTKGTAKNIKKKCRKKQYVTKVFDWCQETCGKVGLGQCKR